MLPPVVEVLVTGDMEGTDPHFQYSSAGPPHTLSISAVIALNWQHSGIQMESCQSPLGQSWPWEPLERQMRLICVFYAFHNECLNRETRWGAGEGHKRGGRVCEILLSLWLCALSCRFIIESLLLQQRGRGGLEHSGGSCSLAAFSPQRLSMETDLKVVRGKKKSYYASQWGTDDTVWICQGVITRSESVADRKTLQVCVTDSAPSLLLPPSLHFEYLLENFTWARPNFAPSLK